MATKFDSYKYSSETEFLQSLTDSGYTLNDGEPLIVGNNIITDDDSGENLEMNYQGVIPLDDLEPPTMSSDVFMVCSRKGSIKLPSSKKVKGNERKWVWSNVNRYFGEGEPTE